MHYWITVAIGQVGTALTHTRLWNDNEATIKAHKVDRVGQYPQSCADNGKQPNDNVCGWFQPFQQVLVALVVTCAEVECSTETHNVQRVGDADLVQKALEVAGGIVPKGWNVVVVLSVVLRSCETGNDTGGREEQIADTQSEQKPLFHSSQCLLPSSDDLVDQLARTQQGDYSGDARDVRQDVGSH